MCKVTNHMKRVRFIQSSIIITCLLILSLALKEKPMNFYAVHDDIMEISFSKQPSAVVAVE